MTNSTINSTALTQRQSNRRLRKRKHLTEITRSSKPSKHVLADAAPNKRRQLYPIIPTPPLTEELTPRKAADTVSHSEHYNCDHIWDLIRESKARQYPSNPCLANLCPATMNAKDDSTAITGKTTTTQARKEQIEFAEQVLHPRWIAIQYDHGPFAKPLDAIRKTIEASDGEQSPDFRSIIGDELFASIDQEHGILLNKLRYLRRSQASEAQWEARLWRRWFLKDSIQDPDDRSNTKPFVGQIVQAKMTLSGGGAVLPPLLASADARRQSGRVVAAVPWNPDPKKQKGNYILRYPDYLYAVSQSSPQFQKQYFQVDEFPSFQFDNLPAFRLAQYKYLPANWIAEIKSENTDANHLAAEHYTALLSAYLLHERLLLHWIAKNKSIKSNNPVEFSHNLAVYCITCCGEVCKIWRMSIRKWTKTSSDLEPVRYDMQLLETLDLEDDDGDQRLCDWINALNALALTVQYNDIIADLKEIGIQANENEGLQEEGETYSWTSKVGFVYKAGSTTQICVAPLGELRKAYNNGAITVVGQIGDKVIQEWDENGQPIEVDITRKGEPIPEPDASPTSSGEHVPEPGASSTLPPVPSAGEQAPEPDASSTLPPVPSAGEQVPEPGASSTLPGASSTLPSTISAGNARIQFIDVELRRLSSSGVGSIAKALSNLVNPGEDIGSTKHEHETYITRVQQVLATGWMQMDTWKDINLSKGDLNRLRVENLRGICDSIGARNPGPTATKKSLVEALST